MACYAVLLGIAAAHQQASPRNVGLTAWLAGHHLRGGLAPYWEAASITVDSGGAVQVLALAKAGSGHVVPGTWQSDPRLAETKGSDARFVVISPSEDIKSAAVIRTFGRPAAGYRYQGFIILVWLKNLMPELAHSAVVEARRDWARQWRRHVP
jgi:hypothetical protein